MKDSTTSEISNLFQELIVSKIKDEIELLKREIEKVEEINESCEGIVEKLPKSRDIEQIVEGEQAKVIELINKIAQNSKSEKYLRDIVAYLKKQYSFSDERTLCLVLDEIQQKNNEVFNEIVPLKTFVETNNIESNLAFLTEYIQEQFHFSEDKFLCAFLEKFSDSTEENIATIIANQESFLGKYDAIVAVLDQYKEGILAQINVNFANLERIKEQLEENQQVIKNNGDSITTVIGKCNDEVEQISDIKKTIDSILQKADDTSISLNNVIANIGPKSEIVALLRSMNSIIENEEEGSESEWSVKKELLYINKNVEELLEKNNQHDKMINEFYEKYYRLEKSKNMIIKILVTGNIISAMGVIALILMYIF